MHGSRSSVRRTGRQWRALLLVPCALVMALSISTGGSVASALTDVAPLAPTAVSATAKPGTARVPGPGSATVSWAAPAPNGGTAITGYTVTSAPEGHTCTTATLTCDVGGLTDGTPYTFTVTATNAAGTGPASAPSGAITTIGAPDALTPTTHTIGDRSIIMRYTSPTQTGGKPLFSWWGKCTSPTGVQVYRSTHVADQNQVTVPGLTAGAVYTCTISVSNASYFSPETPVVTGFVPDTVPAVPTAVSATAGPGSATVSWTAPVANGGTPVTGYLITPYVGFLAQTPVVVNSSVTSYPVTGLTNGTAYTFKVQATNLQGTGPLSVASNPVTPLGGGAVPGPPTGVAGIAGDGQVTVTWTAPASPGDSPISGYAVAASPGTGSCTTAGALSCTVTGLTNGTAYTFSVTASNLDGPGSASAPSNPVTPAAPSGDLFTSLAPVRVQDSRPSSQVGPYSTPWGNQETRDVTVAGVAGVPLGADSVVLNVTVTNTTGYSNLVVWPKGQAKPVASSLNWSPGWTIPNAVTVKVGAGGQISLYNNSGTTDVVVDVVGYFETGTGSAFHPLSPVRIQDSRPPARGPYLTPWANGQTRPITVTTAGVPSNAVGVLLNVTVTNTTGSSNMVVWPTGQTKPVASSLNWLPGWTIPNAVTAKVGASGQINIYNNVGSTDVIADLAGWYG